MLVGLLKKILVATLIAKTSVGFAESLSFETDGHSQLIDLYMSHLERKIEQIPEPDMEDLASRKLNPRQPKPLPPGSLMPVLGDSRGRWYDPNIQDSISEITGQNKTFAGLADQQRRAIAAKNVTDKEKSWAIREALRLISLDIQRIEINDGNAVGLEQFLHAIDQRFRYGAERIGNDILRDSEGSISDGLNPLERVWFYSGLKAARNRLILEWYLAKISGLMSPHLDYGQMRELETDRTIPLAITQLRGVMLFALHQIRKAVVVTDQNIVDVASKLGENSRIESDSVAEAVATKAKLGNQSEIPTKISSGYSALICSQSLR